MTLCNKLNVNPIWFDHETPTNKYKFLKIYQVSIKNAHYTNLQSEGQSEELKNKINRQKKYNKNLKDEIIAEK